MRGSHFPTLLSSTPRRISTRDAALDVIFAYVVHVGSAKNAFPSTRPVQYVDPALYVKKTIDHLAPATATVAGMDIGVAM
jgi:hypothetical protein